MGKFSRNREYTFVSLEELISSVIEEYNDGNDINIVVPWTEVNDVLVPLISTGKFVPYLLDYGLPEMDGYGYEYTISINHFQDNALFVEPTYNKEKDEYFTFCDTDNNVTFVSDNVSTNCYNKILKDGIYVVLYNIED